MKRECIDKLAKLLDKAGIPYERRPMWGGEQIRIGNLCDAVCHDFSYGNEDDLLEIMSAVTEEEESEHGGVLGFLTPEEVAKRFVYCYKYNTDIYHEEKELTAKDYYEGLIERWRERIDEINAHTDPESQSRAEWDVLEEVIFEVSLGFPLLK